MNGGRRTALMLVMVILLVELVLSGKGQEIWGAMWEGPFPLGQGISTAARTVTAESKTSSTGGAGGAAGGIGSLANELKKGSAGGMARTNTTGE